jgi:hypothetical protein
MADRREPPDGLDYFATPPWATRALFVHVLPVLGVEAVKLMPRPFHPDRDLEAQKDFKKKGFDLR